MNSDEPPPLAVAARRRLDRQPETFDDDLRLDRPVQVQPLANGSGGGEQMVG